MDAESGLCSLQDDCQRSAYEAITLAFCWAHLRRRFFDIAQGGLAPIADEVLERIAALYAIEKTIRGRSAGETPRDTPGKERAWSRFIRPAARGCRQALADRRR